MALNKIGTEIQYAPALGCLNFKGFVGATSQHARGEVAELRQFTGVSSCPLFIKRKKLPTNEKRGRRQHLFIRRVHAPHVHLDCQPQHIPTDRHHHTQVQRVQHVEVNDGHRDADVGLSQGIAVPRQCLAPRPPE